MFNEASIPPPSQQVNAPLIHMVGIQHDLSSIEIHAEMHIIQCIGFTTIAPFIPGWDRISMFPSIVFMASNHTHRLCIGDKRFKFDTISTYL